MSINNNFFGDTIVLADISSQTNNTTTITTQNVAETLVISNATTNLVSMVEPTLGSELIRNGNLDELGAELIPDGNFTSQSAVDFWGIAESDGQPRATKTLEDGFMRLTFLEIEGSVTGSALLKFSTIPTNKSYKVSFKAKGTAIGTTFGSIGDFNNISSNPDFVISNPALSTSFQDYEFYVPYTSTNFRLYLVGSIEPNQTLDITNISIKQLDPDGDWNLNGWNFGDSNLFCDGSQTSTQNLVQQSVFTDLNDTYIVTFDLTRTAGSVTFSSGSLSSGAISESKSVEVIGTIGSGSGNFNLTASDDFDGSISNVSVKTYHGGQNISLDGNNIKFEVTGKYMFQFRITLDGGSNQVYFIEPQLVSNGVTTALTTSGFQISTKASNLWEAQYLAILNLPINYGANYPFGTTKNEIFFKITNQSGTGDAILRNYCLTIFKIL